MANEYEELLEAYRRTFLSEMGQVVLTALERQYLYSSVYENPERPGAIDPLKLAYFEGQRSLVLGIRNTLRQAVDAQRRREIGSEPLPERAEGAEDE